MNVKNHDTYKLNARRSLVFHIWIYKAIKYYKSSANNTLLILYVNTLDDNLDNMLLKFR